MAETVRIARRELNEAMRQRSEIDALKICLRELVDHTIECERKLDEFEGLGNDAGSGSSTYVCNALFYLSK